MIGPSTSTIARRMLIALGLALLAIAPPSPPDARAVDLFAATDRGTLYRSTNYGVTWAEQGAVSEPRIAGLQSGLLAGTLFLLGETGDTYASSDAGATWSVVGNAGASDCVDLAVGRNGDLLALTRRGDLLRSTTGGATWTPISNAGFSDGVAVSIGGTDGSADSLYAIAASGDAVASANGSSWSVVGNAGYPQIVDLVWTASVLRALTDAGELLVSTNRGATWNAVGAISQVGMRGVTVFGGSVLAITKEGEVAQSASGVSWTWIGTLNQVYVVAMALGAPEFRTGAGDPPRPPPGLIVRAYPNPFAQVVQLRVRAAAGTPALGADAFGDPLAVSVFDAAGRLVARPYAGPLGAAPDEIAWRPANAAPGVYFLRVDAGASTETRRLVLIR